MIESVEIVDNTNTPIGYLPELENFRNGTKFKFNPGVNIIIDVNRFWMELDDGTTIEITEQEYNSMMKDRIDLPSIKFAELVIDRLDEDFGLDVTKDAEERIYKACSIFDNSQYWKYNTSGYRSRIVNGDTDKLKDEPNLVKLSETIQDIMSNLTPKKDAE